ncbi:MAG: hypothetical protein LBC83_04865 [Oscillospiraceae bacterium]|jgi:uridine kinase|nr:hypothetical protein [Oscillospiraceae bacterium]
MAEIHNELEYINTMASENPLGMIEKAEQRYRNIIGGVAARVLRAHGRKLILLAGPSASGKTTTAQKIADALGKAGVETHRVSLDDFYLPEGEMPLLPDGSRDLEGVNALDLSLLQGCLQSLMQTGRGLLPTFDFAAGKRGESRELQLDAEDMLVVEGLHALHPRLLDMLDGGALCGEQTTKVYISVASRIYNMKQEIILNKRSLRLARRILRDSQFRKSSAEETIEMWPAVARGEEQWLTPYKPNADVLINSIHIYEPCVFREYLLPLLNVCGSSPAKRLAWALEQFLPLPAASVPPDSLLREFLGAAGENVNTL